MVVIVYEWQCPTCGHVNVAPDLKPEGTVGCNECDGMFKWEDVTPVPPKKIGRPAMTFKRVREWQCWEHVKEHGIIYRITGDDGMYMVYRKWAHGEAAVAKCSSLSGAFEEAQINFLEWLNDEHNDLCSNVKGDGTA